MSNLIAYMTPADLYLYLKKLLPDMKNLTQEIADMLHGYMEGHGYYLYVKDGSLHRVDSCNDFEEEEYSFDEMVDAVYQWNEELSKAAQDNLPENVVALCTQYDADEAMLDILFPYTSLGKALKAIS